MRAGDRSYPIRSNFGGDSSSIADGLPQDRKRFPIAIGLAAIPPFTASLPILDLAYISVRVGKIGMRDHAAVVAADYQLSAELRH